MGTFRLLAMDFGVAGVRAAADGAPDAVGAALSPGAGAPPSRTSGGGTQPLAVKRTSRGVKAARFVSLKLPPTTGVGPSP